MCEHHRLTHTESKNSVSFIFTTVSQNTSITIISGNNNNNSKTVKQTDEKCVNHIHGCDLLPQEGVNPKDNYTPSIDQLPGNQLTENQSIQASHNSMLDKINDI